ncbi:MAG: hypothetical protein ACYTEU_01615 [Planctomycetota bacterium]|jgi:NADH:ubiquinone oxidoreductase subunit 3 (subunit A)
MRLIAKYFALLMLLVLIGPSMPYLAGKMSSLDQVKWMMLLTTILWFVCTPLWMWKENGQ